MTKPIFDKLPFNHPLRYRETIEPPDIKTQAINYVQNKLDSLAQAKGYDNIISACTYVNSTIPKFAQEANEFLILRDTAWDICYSILTEVESGSRAIPILNEIIAELPLALR